jgi:hypothetical protein
MAAPLLQDVGPRSTPRNTKDRSTDEHRWTGSGNLFLSGSISVHLWLVTLLALLSARKFPQSLSAPPSVPRDSVNLLSSLLSDPDKPIRTHLSYCLFRPNRVPGSLFRLARQKFLRNFLLRKFDERKPPRVHHPQLLTMSPFFARKSVSVLQDRSACAGSFPVNKPFSA